MVFLLGSTNKLAMAGDQLELLMPNLMQFGLYEAAESQAEFRSRSPMDTFTDAMADMPKVEAGTGSEP